MSATETWSLKTNHLASSRRTLISPLQVKVQLCQVSHEFFPHRGSWWWSSGQRVHLLLRRYGLESCWLRSTILVKKNENNEKEAGDWPINKATWCGKAPLGRARNFESSFTAQFLPTTYILIKYTENWICNEERGRERIYLSEYKLLIATFWRKLRMLLLLLLLKPSLSCSSSFIFIFKKTSSCLFRERCEFDLWVETVRW